MKKITLTQGQFALVDNDDYESLSIHKWYAAYNPHTRSFYAQRREEGGHIARIIRMHREILGLKRFDTTQCDHVNHDTLDNRRENLRRVTATENNRNRRLFRNNRSGVSGVCWRPDSRRWAVTICRNSIYRHVGYYKDFQSAVDARTRAVEQFS